MHKNIDKICSFYLSDESFNKTKNNILPILCPFASVNHIVSSKGSGIIAIGTQFAKGMGNSETCPVQQKDNNSAEAMRVEVQIIRGKNTIRSDV
jgi:hypothetical protein